MHALSAVFGIRVFYKLQFFEVNNNIPIRRFRCSYKVCGPQLSQIIYEFRRMILPNLQVLFYESTIALYKKNFCIILYKIRTLQIKVAIFKSSVDPNEQR